MIAIRHFGRGEWGIVSTSYSPILRAEAKLTPGMRWEPSASAWIGYADAVAVTAARAKARGLIIQGNLPTPILNGSPLPIASKGLRDYQIVGSGFLVANAATGALLADEMSLGKSCQALTAARALRGDEATGGRTIVVCPAHARGVWQDEAAKWWPKAAVTTLSGTKPNAIGAHIDGLAGPDIVIIHQDILYAWADSLIEWQPRTLIIDECFPAGTLIDGWPIEKLASGDAVKTAIGMGSVGRTMCRSVHIGDMILIQTDDGREIICTWAHPFLLAHYGWLQAGLLQPVDTLIDGRYSRALWRKHVGMERRGEELCSMRAGVSHQEAYEQMLFCTLREEMGLGAAEIQSEADGYEGGSEVQRGSLQELEGRSSTRSEPGGGNRQTNAREESDAPAWRNRTPQSLAQEIGAYTEGARRQRQAASVTGEDARQGSRPKVEAVGGDDRGRLGAPVSLQDRSGPHRSENRDRSRRGLSLREEGSRQAQGSFSSLPRVVRVAVPQQADFERLGLGGPDGQGRVRVFNLEVIGHPSYTVCGLVVHNCHNFQGERARRTQALMRLAHVTPYRIALSGTPMTSRPKELWAPVEILSEGRFGRAFHFFLRYADAKKEEVAKDRVVWTFKGATHLDELHERLKFFMLRRLKSEVALELPTRTRQIIEVEIPRGKIVAPTQAMRSDRILRKSLDMSADGKIPQVIDLVISHLEAGAKVVVGCYRKAVVAAIAEGVAQKIPVKAAIITGDVIQSKRDAIIKSAPQLLCCTLDSTETAINLSFADVAVVAELVWVPKTLIQWEGRFGRVKGRNILIQYVIGRGSIDEVLKMTLISKLDRFQETIGKVDNKLAEDLRGLDGAGGAAERLRQLYAKLLED
jgi:hypothetical protein